MHSLIYFFFSLVYNGTSSKLENILCTTSEGKANFFSKMMYVQIMKETA